jgi:hypothetical protein
MESYGEFYFLNKFMVKDLFFPTVNNNFNNEKQKIESKYYHPLSSSIVPKHIDENLNDY